MSFPRYPAYKDSGIAWLKSIPSHWAIVQLRHLADCLDGQRIPLNSAERSDRKGDVPYWGANSVQDHIDAHLFDEELVLLGEDGAPFFDKTKPVAFRSEGRIWPNNHIHVLRPRIKGDSAFLTYCLNATDFADYVDGSTRDKLTQSAMNRIAVTQPSEDERTAIVHFLDRETAKIDALVAEQEQLITLLKEKRQAVISHAVTKGLDLSVPMKDSGVEWLGEVPEHWEVTHLKRRCALVTDGAHISPETEGGVHLFVSTKDISDDGIDFDGALRTSPASYEYMVKTGCQPASGDVLFSKDGTIGRTVVVNGATEFVIASSLIIIRPIPDQLNSDFLNALCQSWVVSQQVDGFVKGAGLPRLSIQNLLKVVGVFPPIDEQVQIANYLSDLDMRSRTLALEAERTVALLKERRSALISAAVTGQIDVRGLVTAKEAA